MKKVVAIIQARIGSTRLPGKVLMPILEKPMILYLLERLKSVKKIDEVIVATSKEEENNPIRELCKKQKILCFSGNEEDVLDRFYNAAKQYKADIIVRITGDCPLIDPKLIEKLLNSFEKNKYDHIGIATGAGVAKKENNGFRYPDGVDAEIFTFSTLETAWKKAKSKLQREHVTPFIWQNPNKFKIGIIKSDIDYSKMRWTVDNKEDLKLIREIYKNLYQKNTLFGVKEVVSFLEKNPKLLNKNSKFIGQEGYEEFWNKNKINQEKGQKLWKKAKQIIPGGSQLLSKRAEMLLPEQWPAYYQKAKGVEIWGLDGNKYIDMGLMGVSACTLGYADKDVNEAVKKAIDKGSASTLNCPEEVELAELLIKIHPWAKKVRFARTGGEAVAIAIRIARTYTKRDKVAFCGYHGWHDWYLSSNLADNSNLDGNLLPGLKPAGVPRGLKGTAIPFCYNKIEELKKIVKENEIGVIIMEPMRETGPENNFLQEVRKIADEINAVLIFDEISSAWKINVGGIHLTMDINPDIAVFSKGMGNGYPIAAIIGKDKVMRAAQDSFISSTMWSERIGPVAAIATINKMLEKNVPKQLIKIGTLIGDGWKKLAKKYNLKIKILGLEPVKTLQFDYPNNLEIKTLFTQEMLKRNYLVTDHVFVSYAHTEKIVKEYLKNVDEIFNIIKNGLENNNVKELLDGPVVHSRFKRLTN